MKKLVLFMCAAFSFGCAKMQTAGLKTVYVDVPGPTVTVPGVCAPPPAVKRVRCYEGKKLVLEAFVVSLADLKCSSKLKCKVE